METAWRTDQAPLPGGGRLVLGRYRLVSRLGTGGFGTVWRARDEHLGRDVALKRIPLEEPTSAGARAEREAMAAARLAHPGIVALFEAGRDEEAHVLVSELVEGGTLGARLAQGALSDRDVLEIGVALSEALAHAHARGVVHRDVKPPNVLCPDRPAEAGSVAKLTDFGVARLVGTDALTRTGDVVGTLAYMAPEQAAGRGVGPPADVWALALVLYEALAGENPVRGDNAAATARNLLHPVPPLARARPDLPRGAVAAIDAALEADPHRRAQLADLRDHLDGALPLADVTPGIIVPPVFEEASPEDAWARREEPHLGDGARAERWTVAPVPQDAPRQRRTGLQARAAGALATGALVLAAVTLLGPSAPVEPMLAGLAVAAAAVLLPRLTWLAAAAGLVAWLATTLPGVALLLALAVLPVPPLLLLAPATWSLPMLAPLLGAVGAATAFPAAAGQAGTPLRRAMLGGLGAWWLALAEALVQERLLLGTPGDLPPSDAWQASLRLTAQEVVPTLATPTLALAAGAFALAAAVLPYLVRGTNAAIDLLAAGGWAIALAAALGALAPGTEPRGVAVGAVVGALAAVGARAVRGRR
ncbi:MAG TPA: serine/threonine-protein kinase [Solirubrobacteraceae bacterium]|nr:serine/threonine-protein kinase [Solirubrobacteraceae bacterium]